MGNPVILTEYSADWPQRFEAEREHLAKVFPAARIEHVGSTSVPGLGAKPIVDILLGASSLAEIEERIPMLEAMGYEYVERFNAIIPERRFFAKPPPRPRAFHLHAVTLDCGFFRDHLAFRDALRRDPALAQAYWALKQDLARKHADDLELYTEMKSPFIRSILSALGH